MRKKLGRDRGEKLLATEQAHSILKSMLLKQKRGSAGMGYTSHKRLQKALHVLNFLNCIQNDLAPVQHRFSVSQTHLEKAQVYQWESPFPLITWGWGYACVSTDSGPRWVPARVVRPALVTPASLLGNWRNKINGACLVTVGFKL